MGFVTARNIPNCVLCSANGVIGWGLIASVVEQKSASARPAASRVLQYTYSIIVANTAFAIEPLPINEPRQPIAYSSFHSTPLSIYTGLPEKDWESRDSRGIYIGLRFAK